MQSAVSLSMRRWNPGIVLCMRSANERRRYNVTSPLIGWAHTQNDPWKSIDHTTYRRVCCGWKFGRFGIRWQTFCCINFILFALEWFYSYDFQVQWITNRYSERYVVTLQNAPGVVGACLNLLSFNFAQPTLHARNCMISITYYTESQVSKENWQTRSCIINIYFNIQVKWTDIHFKPTLIFAQPNLHTSLISLQYHS